VSLHTATNRGKRVRIKKRDGTVFVDKFLDRTDSAVQLQDHGWVSKSDIQSMSDFQMREHCKGKINYKSEMTAVRAAREMHKKKKEPFQAYQCKCCGGWHIGHGVDLTEVFKALENCGVGFEIKFKY
jgi:hypothetical protein